MSIDPVDELRTAPPRHSMQNIDIITGPLKSEDQQGNPLVTAVGLNTQRLTEIRQIAFCTDNAVSYLNACYSKVRLLLRSLVPTNDIGLLGLSSITVIGELQSPQNERSRR